MILFEIVAKIACQIKPLLYRYSKGLLCYAFFDVVYYSHNQKGLSLFMGLLHNADYVVAAVFGGYFSIRRSRHSAKLYYQPHIFHTLTMFVAGSDNISSCGVNATVTEYIRELGNVLFDTVEGSCE